MARTGVVDFVRPLPFVTLRSTFGIFLRSFDFRCRVVRGPGGPFGFSGRHNRCVAARSDPLALITRRFILCR